MLRIFVDPHDRLLHKTQKNPNRELDLWGRPRSREAKAMLWRN